MTQWHHETDFLVVGSGGGGMTAAITAYEYGLNSMVIEKADCYGGTTAVSGGVVWIPNNHRMPDAGVQDSEEDALSYLRQVISDDVPDERIQAYVKESPKMMKFLEEVSLVKYDPAPVYPDYYAELEGGKPGARSMDPKPYSIRSLGDELYANLRLSEIHNPNGFSMTADEAHKIFSFSWRSNIIIFQRILSFWLDIPARLKKWPDNRLTLGKALISRLRHSLHHKNIPLWLNTPAKELVITDGKLEGVVCEKDGKPYAIKVNKGVLLATGGFAHNEELRKQYHPQPTGTAWTAASKADKGDGIIMGQEAGAKTGMMSYAWWSPTMKMPNGTVEAFIVGKSMPGCALVNKSGKRILNEAEPYEDFVKHQYEAHSDEVPSIPGFFVFDSRYRSEYPLGSCLGPGKFTPDVTAKDLFDSGWIKKADSLQELAELCGIDAEGLQETMSRMGRFAEQGKDEDFGKGSTLNDLYYSDHRVTPNPCLAPIGKPPFYCINIWPGDLGTKGGLVTDEHARVMSAKDDTAIEGLYATGNTTASVMGDSYPGAGSTIGPSMTFGYVAAKHAAGVND